MSDRSDTFTSLEDAPRSDCCDVPMVWIECENCDGFGFGANGKDEDCAPCDGFGGEWTCPECNL